MNRVLPPPTTDGHVLTLDSATAYGAKWVAAPGVGGGDSIQVNGVAVTDANFRDGTPAAPAASVNVTWQRSGAGPDFDKVAEALPAGTKLMIVEQLNGWYLVFAPISGYVLKKYLSKPDAGV